MSDKKFKKIKNTIIAGASSGIMAGMFLVGGMNTAFAESVDGMRTYIQDSSYRGTYLSTRTEGKTNKTISYKKNKQKGWRKNAF